jgi:c-di-GMP-related signal transduction protein
LARRAEFRDFQEQVFLKPQLFRRRAIAGTRHNALDLMKAIMKNPLELAQIERILRGDPALNYKLLRQLNSPEMERKVEGWSTRSAISLLGEQEFSRWALLVALVTPATDKTNFCE